MVERFIQLFVFVSFLVIGVSHIANARGWDELFALLRAKGRPGVIVNGMLSLTAGSLIVAGHNVWQGLPILVTLVGWAQLLKGFLHLSIPGIGERSLALARTNAESKFRVGGAALLLLDVPIGYLVFARL